MSKVNELIERMQEYKDLLLKNEYDGDSTYVYHEGSWKRVNDVKDDGKPHEEGGGNWYHIEGVKDPIHQSKRGKLASGHMLNAGYTIKKDEVKYHSKDTADLIGELRYARQEMNKEPDKNNKINKGDGKSKLPPPPKPEDIAGKPPTKEQMETWNNMPESEKQRILNKEEVIKALVDAGLREDALLYKNWGELSDTASKLLKSLEKDDLDEKIKAKMKAEMKRRNFTEADATRHVIDRDRGEQQSIKPKKPELLQSELTKSNYGPKGMKLYDPAKSIKRKQTRTGEEIKDAGKNVGVRQYTTTGSERAKAHEKKMQAEQNKKTKASTKIYTDEEKAALAAKMGVKVSPKKES